MIDDGLREQFAQIRSALGYNDATDTEEASNLENDEAYTPNTIHRSDSPNLLSPANSVRQSENRYSFAQLLLLESTLWDRPPNKENSTPSAEISIPAGSSPVAAG